MATGKDIRALINELVSEGWQYLGQTKHHKMRSPKGFLLSFSVSPSCEFVIKKIKSDIRRIKKREEEIKRAVDYVCDKRGW